MDNHTDLEGKCLRDGVDLRELDSQDIVALFFSYLVDDYVSGETTRNEAREAVQGWLDSRAGFDEDGLPAYTGRQSMPDPDTWGLEPQHQAGMQNAMQWAAGGST